VLLHTTDPAPGLFEISTFSMEGQSVTVKTPLEQTEQRAASRAPAGV
jgi:hypothetical protein